MPAETFARNLFGQRPSESHRHGPSDLVGSTTGTGGFTPINGVILWYGAAADVPAGWAICDGSNGTPDLRGRVPVGVDTTQTEFDTLGEAGGAKTHTLTTAELPAHSHDIHRTANQANSGGGGGIFSIQANSGTSMGTTQGTGSGGAHNNLQPYRALHFIMRIS